MRKVMYSLNSLSEQAPGYFHCWAGTMQDAYAIIEDTTTGKMHRVNDDHFRFMTPPEKVKKVVKCAGCEGHGKIAPLGNVCPICKGERVTEMTFEWLDPLIIDRNAKVEIINIETLGTRVLDVLLPVLESINKKLSTL